MTCPHCQSEHCRKNGHKRGNQNYLCRDGGRQFVENPKPHRGYSDDIRKLCLRLYVNGMGFRAIERVIGIYHTTVIIWVKQVGASLPGPEVFTSIPNVGELDELETFVGSKKQDLDLDRCGSL